MRVTFLVQVAEAVLKKEAPYKKYDVSFGTLTALSGSNPFYNNTKKRSTIQKYDASFGTA